MQIQNTWAKNLTTHLYFIVADGVASRWSFRNCDLKELDILEKAGGLTTYNWHFALGNICFVHYINLVQHSFRDPSIPTGKCHNEPRVILTNACDDKYYHAQGPCCKFDAAVTFATSTDVRIREGVFHNMTMDYFVFADDDQYFEPRALLNWLQKANLVYGPSAIFAGGCSTNMRSGIWGEHNQGCGIVGCPW